MAEARPESASGEPTATTSLETTTVRRAVPSVREALTALDKMRTELTAARTYESISRIIQRAKALEVLLHDVDEVKVSAQDTILLASRRIGEEINKIPKATPAGPGRGLKQKAARGPLFSAGGRTEVPFAGTSRKRFQKLAAIPVKVLKQASDRLRAQGKDATVSAVVQAVTQGSKAERRTAREVELAAKITALPDERFGVIVADPEWRFEPYSRETGMDRAADNHYPTSELEAIKARDVASIAAKDSVLFLWATAPLLPQALEVMKAWGFSYRSSDVWLKNRPGTGYWSQVGHEFLLVGTRGQPAAPAKGADWGGSVIVAASARHSAKPEIVLERIERLWPDTPKIELNRRGKPRPGWSAWGAEAA